MDPVVIGALVAGASAVVGSVSTAIFAERRLRIETEESDTRLREERILRNLADRQAAYADVVRIFEAIEARLVLTQGENDPSLSEEVADRLGSAVATARLLAPPDVRVAIDAASESLNVWSRFNRAIDLYERTKRLSLPDNVSDGTLNVRRERLDAMVDAMQEDLGIPADRANQA